MVDGITLTIFQFLALMLYLAHNNRGKNVTHVEQATQPTTDARHTPGFALPTILISSIVMLIVLLAAVTSTTAVRTAIKTQYYTQLAQVAGDAGVAYAKACLNANGGLPQWSNANPLMPNTNCSGAQLAGFSCPSIDARCSVTLNGDVRSSFSIGMPPVDATGKALTLPNTGFVEILRTSNGAVWRRYQQNTVPSVAVPDLCSGSATSVLGWNNAAITTTTFPIPEPTAKPIAIATGNLNSGPNYFRKDFSVTQAGVYTLTANSDGHSNFYIDSALVLSMYNTTATSVTVNLAVGCHTIMVRDTNGAILPGGFNIMASLKLNGASSPIVVSDTTWRVSAGNPVHYSSVNYYTDLTAWTPVRDIMPATSTVAAGYWLSRSGDSTARYINTTHSYDGSGNYPAGYAVFKDSRIINIVAPTQVRLAYGCDDSCSIYLDGAVVANGNNSDINTTILTLSEGLHSFGVALNNVASLSGFDLAVVRTADNVALTVSDVTWSAANFWSATDPNSYSYDNTYTPNPSQVPIAGVAKVLVVAGGGSGGGSSGQSIASGGGGAGGVIYNSSYSLSDRTYAVTVGNGGTGVAGFTAGNNGQNSIFGSLRAIGGGYGGTWVTAPTGGGSGGAAGENGQTLDGAAGILGQGYAGGNDNGYDSLVPSAGGGGGGGGAIGGSSTTDTIGGNGGIGFLSSISNSSVYYGGGGGGAGSTTLGSGGNGGGGNGRGVTTGTGTSGAANTGGGGGGSLTNVNEAAQPGGAGGSGVVIISYPTGSMTATGGTITILGGNTIHTFTTSGTFTVTSS